MYWLGEMFQPLNFAAETTRRFHHRSGTVEASLTACRSKSRTIFMRSRVSVLIAWPMYKASRNRSVEPAWLLGDRSRDT